MIAKFIEQDDLGIEISHEEGKVYIEVGRFDDGLISAITIPIDEFINMLEAVKIKVV